MNILKFLKKAFTYEYKHYKDHRLDPKYKAKKRIVRNVWTVSGCIMILLLHLQLSGFAAFLAAITTFVGFVILDETD